MAYNTILTGDWAENTKDFCFELARSRSSRLQTNASRRIIYRMQKNPMNLPRALPSPATEVSLWWCPLEQIDSDRANYERWLAEAERIRMARFGTPALRARYAAGRASLRLLLARCLGVEPGEVPITRGVRGRPQLAETTDVDFNVSHTGEFALIGIARGLRIGVDIERENRTINTAGIARKFMTERERAQCGPFDTDDARRRVLRLWTCKEAMSKATGDALSAPFADIDVRLEPNPRLAAGPPPYQPADWRLDPVATPEGFIGTLARWHARNVYGDSST